MSHQQILLQYSDTAKEQNFLTGGSNTAQAQTTFTIIPKAKAEDKYDTVFGKTSSQNAREVCKKNHLLIINPNYSKL